MTFVARCDLYFMVKSGTPQIVVIIIALGIDFSLVFAYFYDSVHQMMIK